MRERILTALVLLAVLLVAVLLSPRWVAVAVLAAVVLGGGWEWSGFFDRTTTERAARIGYVAVLALLMALTWWATEDPRYLRAVLWAAVVWWILALAWVASFPTPIPRQLTILCGAIVLVPAWLALARLHIGPKGPALLLFVFMLVWAADTGAYFVGRAVGRAKLAPRVSPGKTWEGVLGGLALSTVVAFAGAHWFEAPPASFVPLCVAAALVSVVGDLTVSMFKRHSGLKDSSHLLPGHGGILDRIDSTTAAAPLLVLGLGWLRVLG